MFFKFWFSGECWQEADPVSRESLKSLQDVKSSQEFTQVPYKSSVTRLSRYVFFQVQESITVILVTKITFTIDTVAVMWMMQTVMVMVVVAMVHIVMEEVVVIMEVVW